MSGPDSPYVVIDGAGDMRRTIPDLEARVALGKALRQQVPRRLHGSWATASDRPDPVRVISARNRGRQQRLVPIRIGRMLASPFAFYRGSASLMAVDLRSTPSSGLVVQLCGDAHLSNFGLYASPERHLVADINDFDETSRGRWEWDVKRLAASVELCGRENGLHRNVREEAVAATTRAYRTLLQRTSELPRLEVHFLAFGADDTPPRHWSSEMLSIVEWARRRAFRRTQDQLGVRMIDESGVRLHLDPPVLTSPNTRIRDAVVRSLDRYLETVSPDINELLKDYGVLDVAHKVVGVGSVGTRDYVVLLQGNHPQDHLFLQVKEALPSVVRDPALPGREHHGEHVVDGQRRIQSVSDPFLGWTDVGARPFFVRQLRDMKGGIHPDQLHGRALVDYAEFCGSVLGKAHARTGYPAAISSYCGASDRFDVAMVSFARAYADQVERDHGALAAAVKEGTLRAETGV